MGKYHALQDKVNAVEKPKPTVNGIMAQCSNCRWAAEFLVYEFQKGTLVNELTGSEHFDRFTLRLFEHP